MKMATVDEDEDENESPTDESDNWAETVSLTLLAEDYQENISVTQMDIGKRVFFELRWKPDFGKNFPITMMIGNGFTTFHLSFNKYLQILIQTDILLEKE